MFKFFKEKLKGAVEKFSKDIDKAAKDEVAEKTAEKPKKKAGKKEKIVEKKLPEEKKQKEKKEIKKEEKKGFFGKLKERITAEKAEEKEEAAEAKEKKGILESVREKITTKVLSEKQFDELFWELEVVLLENNVAVDAIEKIKDDLKKSIVEKRIQRGQVQNTIEEALKQSIDGLFSVKGINIFDEIKKKKPYVIVFVGVNGSGKTTTIAKIARLLLDKKKTVVLAAGDTFRAAAIQQLQEHADKLGVKLIKHDYGSDPAAVAFDAIKYAEAKKIDAVLIDTAGRQHANVNLMDEMKKIIRVAKPDLKIFIGESITGNDCIEQAQSFDKAVDIDGIILTKADVDEKGGAAVSVSYVTKKPIIFIGMGQKHTDLKEFDKSIILRSLGF